MSLNDLFVAGVDFRLSGNGGPDCLQFSSKERRWTESGIGAGLSTLALIWGFSSLENTPITSKKKKYEDSLLRPLLLAASSFVFGMEVTYKLASNQVVFCFNPCHLLLLLQIILLALPPSKITTGLYRIHLCLLHGPVMAILFPVTNTRFLSGEVSVFWLEHIFLLINPVYFILSGSYTTPSSLKQRLSWISISYGTWGWFHYALLQPIGIWTLANVNSILCPAISDPFHGPNYRTHAIWHQFLLTLTSGLLCFLMDKKSCRKVV
ncbi:transmembrane protein 164 [Lepeophtheirus salmonis]|uniref:Transmembrane protein 164 [Rattus norvegicus] n=1 Tax=Lepeophtheirus salmonis TaxID=72036 RepID=A0A0K2VEF3_LEPSM|nr:transmembrane protein 164-like [Lepeophtheirus salmonis]